MTKRLLGVLLLAGAFTAIGAAKSEASFIAYICDDQFCQGGNDSIVIDGGAGDSLAGTSGAIVSTYSFGNMTVLVNTSQSKPILGSATSPVMDLNFTVTSTGAGTGQVWMYASDTDFMSLGGFWGTYGGTASGSTQQFGIFPGTSNTPLDLTKGITSGLVSGSPFGGTLLFGPAGVTPFSLTLMAYVNRTAAGTTTGNFNVQPTPELSSMILLGSGLLAVGALARRRVRAKRLDLTRQ
jgi:hypothetical protein